MAVKDVLYITRHGGGITSAAGTLNGRPVRHTWALGSTGGDWVYADEERGYVTMAQVRAVVNQVDGEIFCRDCQQGCYKRSCPCCQALDQDRDTGTYAWED